MASCTPDKPNRCRGRIPCLRRKGQALVLEEVLMFTIGIAIVAGLVFIFSDVDEGIHGFVNRDQAEEIGSLVRAAVISLETSGCTRCNVIFDIPENVGGEKYYIYGEGNKKKILVYNDGDVWNEKNVSVEVYGRVSQSSKMLVEYDNGVVNIKGVDDY